MRSVGVSAQGDGAAGNDEEPFGKRQARRADHACIPSDRALLRCRHCRLEVDDAGRRADRMGQPVGGVSCPVFDERVFRCLATRPDPEARTVLSSFAHGHLERSRSPGEGIVLQDSTSADEVLGVEAKRVARPKTSPAPQAAKASLWMSTGYGQDFSAPTRTSTSRPEVANARPRGIAVRQVRAASRPGATIWRRVELAREGREHTSQSTV